MADNVTTEDLEIALNDLAESMGISVVEYVEGGFLDLTTYGQDKAEILARLDNIDTINAEDDIDSLAEKIVAINAVLSDDDGALQGILDLINVNKADIATLRTDMTGITDALRTDVDNATAKGAANESAINDIKSDVSGYKTTTEDRFAAVEGRTTEVEAGLDTLNADASVEGSVAYAVAAEEARAKNVTGALADLATDEKATVVGAINEVQAETNLAQASANAAMDKATLNEDAIAILNGDDTVEGSVAKAVLDATGGDISDLSDRVDAQEAATADLSGRVDGVEESIASYKTTTEDAIAQAKEEATAAINDEIASREAADAVLSDRTKVVEDILNDTTDEDDNLVKGIVTRTSDLEAEVQANLEKQIADLQAAVDDMKAYSDSNDLKAASMDMCSIGNKFRSALGLGDSTCDDSSTEDDAL